ncbi:MAG: GNAT family N-acetyltransferase/peptidase C39 family protein [Gammaproteobacteria bacterium]|nr:GNAT family N-acetyltransferase/peptidase C39 family protein [Gammaproteobacteria bacterium]
MDLASTATFIRPATLADIAQLVVIENHAFDSDRLTRRNFRYLISEGNASALVVDYHGFVQGYVIILYNSGTSVARLYSLAVGDEYRRRGLGRALIREAEGLAREHDCICLRLEVRPDNVPAIGLFHAAGYKQFGILSDYYEDHTDALRYEKILAPGLAPEMVKAPYYEQTLDFTCGPAAVMMAMRALEPSMVLNRKLELRVWRESTTVFMTAGHGGCGPYGLALSAYYRGFGVEIFVNDPGAMFIDSVRDPEKKEVMRIVQEDFIEELQGLPIKVTYGALTVEEIQQKFDAGGIPIVLISSYRIYREKFPHWVVVTGFDNRYIYVHDPFVDYETGKTLTDCINMPILRRDFARMAQYGKAGQKAVLVISKKDGH